MVKFRRRSAQSRLHGVVLLLAARGILGASNRTIDDDYADGTDSAPISYFPPDQWFQGALCGVNCSTRVDAAQTHDHTWHLAENFPLVPSSVYVQIQFFGTAVYVYNALSNTTATSLTFTLDGKEDGSGFTHYPVWTRDVQYNALVYSNNNLTDAAHTLIMHVQLESVVLFDYVVYTVANAADPGPDSSAKSSQPSNPTPSVPAGTVHETSRGSKVGIIAGTVAGVVGTCMLALALVLFCRRRRRARSSPSGASEEAAATPRRVARANKSYRNTFMLEREGNEPLTSSPSRLAAWSLREDGGVRRPPSTSVTAATEAISSGGDSSDTPTIHPFPLEVQPSLTPSKPSFVPPSLAPPREQTLPAHSDLAAPSPDLPASADRSDEPRAARDADANVQDNASSAGSTDIHVRYARLQQEVARLREEQELQGIFFPEALPRYEDVRAEGSSRPRRASNKNGR